MKRVPLKTIVINSDTIAMVAFVCVHSSILFLFSKAPMFQSSIFKLELFIGIYGKYLSMAPDAIFYNTHPASMFLLKSNMLT